MMQRLAWAFLYSQLYPGASAWHDAQKALTEAANPLGRVESK
jgi:hypothetical protein